MCIRDSGWTITVYSAIDDRIEQTYSVAGSVPIYLRSISENHGDYEQWLPELYEITNYLDLYIMGAYGENRKSIQIFNMNDPCCFSGDLFKSYENEVKESVSNLNKGSFEVYLDDTHKKHQISDYALDITINSITN